MLPDFVRAKAKRQRWFMKILKKEIEKRTPFLNHGHTVIQHEGRGLQYETVEGEQDVVGYDKRSSAQLQINMDELSRMTPQQYLDKAMQMAEDLARQHANMFFAKVNEVCEQAGTVTKAGGKPFDANLLIESLRNVHIDFDEHGNPQLPTLLAGAKQTAALRKTLEQAEASNEWREKWNVLMQQKWVEWRDREADRKLVD